MATVKEKGVTKNSRGTYEVRLKGVYYGSRKTLKEANDLSLSMQMAKTPAKKQSMVTGRKNKTIFIKVKSVKVPGYHYDEPVLIPAPKAAEVVKRLDEQPEKKSFWQFLKDMFK
jgi:hypothetical protein